MRRDAGSRRQTPQKKEKKANVSGESDRLGAVVSFSRRRQVESYLVQQVLLAGTSRSRRIISCPFLFLEPRG
jgi:hypothetical protein